MGHFFALLNPGPDFEYGSGSIDLIESGSNTDPDPKLCFYVRFFLLQGREFTLNGSPYELYSCDTCGQKGVHIGEYGFSLAF